MAKAENGMATAVTGEMIVFGPQMPAWIVWEDLSASEEATLRGMWNRAVDSWLDWALRYLDTEPSDQDFSVSWDMRHTFLSKGQLTELSRLPTGEERRECLYRMLGQPRDSAEE